jgi:hypothetical protein
VKNNPVASDAQTGITDADRQRWKASRLHGTGEPAATDDDASGGLVAGWARFWFSPVSPLGLHWVRFLAGLLFLSWLLPLTGERAALFGLDGWVDAEAYRAASHIPGGAPVPLGWSIVFAAGDSPARLDVIWWGSLAVLALFTLGVATRITAVLTWVIVVSFLASPAAHADTDYMLGILAFYLMIGYLFIGQWSQPLSIVERIFGTRRAWLFAGLRANKEGEPLSYAANFALRLLQVHFAIVMVASGLHKLQYGDWWAGVAYWYPMHPPLAMTAERLQAERAAANVTLFFLSLAGYLVLAWQLTFPLFAFRKRCRPILIGGAAIGWLGCAWLFGDQTFGPFCMVACLSYLTPQEWRWLTDRVRLAWPLDRAVAASGERQARVTART